MTTIVDDDDDDRDSGASSVILAFLLGGLTGAALALLYAPRSGKETRDLLGERMRETAERGRELRDQAIGRGRALVDEAQQYVERQKQELENRKERFTAAVEAGRQAYREEKQKENA
jgi:gas vesicle protein